MNVSEKVGRLGRGLYRVKLSSHGRENLQESCVLPDNCFHDQKRDMTSSGTWSKRFDFFYFVFKVSFCLKLASLCRMEDTTVSKENIKINPIS